ncbi:MAG: hypothetical protein ACRDHP_18270, partial [Ktedonobacterales bacterium]
GWLLFRADTLTGAFSMLRSGLDFSRPALAGFTLSATSTPVLLMGIAAAIVLSGWLWAIFQAPLVRIWQERTATLGTVWYAWGSSLLARPVLYVLAVSVLVLWPPHVSPRFIYFQF